MGIGLGQILIVFMLALLFFGAKRLPEIARAMGQAANEFKKAKDNISSEEDSKLESKSITSQNSSNTEIVDSEIVVESERNNVK